MAEPQRRPPLEAPRPAGGADDLRERGFAHYEAERLAAVLASDAAGLARLQEVCASLPPDPHAPGTHRFRRYSHAVYLPWRDELSWIPGTPDPVHGTVTEFSHGADDPRHRRGRRALPEVPAALRDDALLPRLLRWDVEQAVRVRPDLGRRPLWVGVHLIKLAVEDRDQVAVSTPDCLHQDGGSTGTFTFAHLISRTNVSGGHNVIATPDSAGLRPDDPAAHVHTGFTLTEPLEGYAVHDHRVSHYVAPVRAGTGPGPGERSVLIVGLAPYVPQL
ncbi:2OG-Fe dioxygenase family protein [Streptomyces sp. NPDC059917]|uniref:2OG-Fe dioxygenase family protein n=1 Tax=Streptomyces sp. NPDC059917 TaxID=3347002 RepID=UPI0036564622